MKGKIIKGIAGFYYVHDGHGRVYECQAKGIFRKQGIKPLVGDDVSFAVIREDVPQGNIEEILPRRSCLLRPAIANADQAVILIAATNPEPSLNLLDRFFVRMEWQQLPAILCINKIDLDRENRRSEYEQIYRRAGYPVLHVSAADGQGLEPLRDRLRGKTTVLAGASGVGKSSLLNALLSGDIMETGELSRKLGRGRHTTRHSEMFFLEDDTFVLDTPGFTSLELPAIDEKQLGDYYPEFVKLRHDCRFPDCIHIGERDCAVKRAALQETTLRKRHETYLQLYNDVKSRKKY